MESQSQRAKRQRVRTRKACDVCKLRKRKCDGQHPCHSCRRYQYVCTYTNASALPKSNLRDRTATRPSPVDFQQPSLVDGQPPFAVDGQQAIQVAPTPSATSSASPHPIESQVEATPASGHFLVGQLSKELGAAPTPVSQALGWNLDLASPARQTGNTLNPNTVTSIMSEGTWRTNFDLFVNHVHTLYGFLDIDSVRLKASQRWQEPMSSIAAAYDHILCGVAAIGSLFDPRRDPLLETLLADAVQTVCQRSYAKALPTFEDVEGWLLNTLYLRFTDASPTPVWISSSITMYMLEAAGVHIEDTTKVASSSIDISVDRQRRVFWIATMLNAWISNESGKPSTSLRSRAFSSSKLSPPRATSSLFLTERRTSAVGTQHRPTITTFLPQAHPNDQTVALLELFELSQCLDSSRGADNAEVEEALAHVVDQPESRMDPFILSRSNLVFALYRRLRANNGHQKQYITDNVMKLGKLGLQASSRLICNAHPWWHVVNVPFQFACIALAMDVSQSIQVLPTAIAILERAETCFGTLAPRKALESVRELIRLNHSRKQKQLDALAQCMGGDANTSDAPL